MASAVASQSGAGTQSASRKASAGAAVRAMPRLRAAAAPRLGWVTKATSGWAARTGPRSSVEALSATTSSTAGVSCGTSASRHRRRRATSLKWGTMTARRGPCASATGRRGAEGHLVSLPSRDGVGGFSDPAPQQDRAQGAGRVGDRGCGHGRPCAQSCPRGEGKRRKGDPKNGPPSNRCNPSALGGIRRSCGPDGRSRDRPGHRPAAGRRREAGSATARTRCRPMQSQGCRHCRWSKSARR